MSKIISQNENEISYLVNIEGKKFKIEVSRSGELINISRYTNNKEISASKKRIEFG